MIRTTVRDACVGASSQTKRLRDQKKDQQAVMKRGTVRRSQNHGGRGRRTREVSEGVSPTEPLSIEASVGM